MVGVIMFRDNLLQGKWSLKISYHYSLVPNKLYHVELTISYQLKVELVTSGCFGLRLSSFCRKIIVYSRSTINTYSFLSHEWWVPP